MHVQYKIIWLINIEKVVRVTVFFILWFVNEVRMCSSYCQLCLYPMFPWCHSSVIKHMPSMQKAKGSIFDPTHTNNVNLINKKVLISKSVARFFILLDRFCLGTPHSMINSAYSHRS